MKEYDWLKTKNGKIFNDFAKDLKRRVKKMMVGESSLMLGMSLGAEIRNKAKNLNIPQEEALEYFFRILKKDEDP